MPLRAPADDEDADDQPRAAGDFCWAGESPPDGSAEREAEEGENHVENRVSPMTGGTVHAVLPEDRRVHAHEAEKRAEVQDLGGEFVAHELRAEKSHDAEQDHVEVRRVVYRMNAREDARRKYVFATHPEQQTRCAYLRREPGPDVG